MIMKTDNTRKNNQKYKNCIARIEIAEKAYERYSQGLLTSLEKHLELDPHKLAKNWSESLERERQLLKTLE
jgi:hypothetical protein